MEKLKPILKCDNCNKTFPFLSVLKNHIARVHEKIKKHICENCNKGFVDKRDLQNHISSVHDKIRNFK